jgi:hypothetical protein
MARVDIIIPEPTPVYTEENQRQISQSLQTIKDKLVGFVTAVASKI